LFAPQSGRETRAKISEAARRTREQADESFHSMHEQVRDFKEDLASALQRKGKRAKDILEKERNDAATWQEEV
jgi:gas vesicle protein